VSAEAISRRLDVAVAIAGTAVVVGVVIAAVVLRNPVPVTGVVPVMPVVVPRRVDAAAVCGSGLRDGTAHHRRGRHGDDDQRAEMESHLVSFRVSLERQLPMRMDRVTTFEIGVRPPAGTASGALPRTA
jgi:hypothetical protein